MSVTHKRERILLRRLEAEMKDSFLDYSLSVIVQRALPDVRDGLKPVHRRILFAMHGLGLQPDRSHQKSATVVGEVLGKYHPHGDTAVYDALVRMVQDFSSRYPLVDGQGNFGSVDGDPAAAYRYTEARLSDVATELLDEIGKDTVRWESNFDERLQEPTVLPCRIPNLLTNGCAGIAVGMSTNVPPHNLGEVARALHLLVAKPDCEVAELAAEVLGPDFPTGGYIVGTKGIREMYETGRGRMLMRARMVTESVRGGRKQLVVTEVPYAVSKARIIAQIAGLSRRGALPEVTDLRDESDREGIRLVIELKRGTKVAPVMAKLFKKTSLQSTFGAILLALDGGSQPREFNLKELLERFRDHRLEVIRRRSRFELERAEAELHIIQGLLAALDRIEEVIAIIRGSASRTQAADRLRDRLGLSDIQAEAILKMRLARLTALEGKRLRTKEASLNFAIRQLRTLLNSEALQLEVMLEELDGVVERLVDKRRTVILESADKADFSYVVSEAADEDVVVTCTRQGYVKRIPMHLYRRRMNAGLALAETDKYEADYLERVVVARTRGWLLSFTQEGRLHFLKVEDIPEGSRVSRGRSVYGLLGIDRRSPIVATRPVDDLDSDRYLAFVTRKGLVKRTPLRTFVSARRGGMIAATLRAGDSILDVALTGGDSDLILFTRAGRAIRFPETDVSVVGATAQGVKGIRLRGGDQVAGLVVKMREGAVLLVSDEGHGKRVPLSEFPVQKRGGLGTTTGLAPRHRLVRAMEVLEDDFVMLVSAGGNVFRLPTERIGLRGRGQSLKSVISLVPGDRIVEVTRAQDPGGRSGAGRDGGVVGAAEGQGGPAEPTEGAGPKNRLSEHKLQGDFLRFPGGSS